MKTECLFSTKLLQFSMKIAVSDSFLTITENTEENLGYQPRLKTIQGFYWLLLWALFARFRDAGRVNL